LEISEKYKKKYERECIDLRKEQEDFLALQKKQLTLATRENGVLQQLQEKTASYNELKITHCK